MEASDQIGQVFLLRRIECNEPIVSQLWHRIALISYQWTLISTGSKFSTSCRVDKNYIIRKSSKYWTRISNFLEDVCPGPQQNFFKIDSPAEIARIFRSLSFSEWSIYFFSFFLSALDKDKRIRPCIYITSTAEKKERENHLNLLTTIKAA